MKSPPAPSARPHAEPRWRVALALATVYVIWGSTYFAIGEAVRSIPPFLMASSRFAISGTILYLWRRQSRGVRPDRQDWKVAAIVGGFLILGGNGLVSWSEQRVPSGLAALIVSITPVVAVAIDWLRPGGVRPSRSVVAGLVLGLIGMVVLIGPARLEAAKDADLFSTLVCAAAPCLWAAGSIYSRQAKQAPDVLMSAAMQMLTGAVWLLGGAVVLGEFSNLSFATITPASAIAWLYLTLVGSLAGFTAYIYLLKVTTPAIATTYSYVNPAVAVLLGWWLGNELITGRILFAGALLLGSVVLITAFKTRRA